MKSVLTRALLLTAVATATGVTMAGPPAADDPAVKRVEVSLDGGHETDPRDRGRPVILVASALGVPADVFREAFKKVKPAPAGEKPDPAQVRRNKQALMEALGKYGVTSERLDEVSNHYRYRPGEGRLWPTKPAKAVALVRDGMVIGYEVSDGGSGYSSPPRVNVPGLDPATATAELGFDNAFEQNGRVTKIAPAKADKD